LSLTELQLIGTDAKTFFVGIRGLDVPIKELKLPAGGAAAETRTRVALGDARLTAPTVLVTRTADGIVLPQLSVGAPAAQPAPAVAPTRRVDVALDALRATEGQVSTLDRTVKPFFNGRLSRLGIELRDVRFPRPAASKIRISATGPGKGTIDVYGSLTPDEGWFEVNGERIALLPFNPYAKAFSSYSISRGTASISTKGSFDSGSYYTHTWLTLQDFDLESSGGDSLFQQQFGIPLSMALAIMRDLNGHIVLGMPAESGAEGTKVDVLSVIGGALRRALVNAVASPLKLIGAALGGDGAKVVAPVPIAFRPGRAEFDASGEEQINQLAEFLASHPGVGVTLAAAVTNGDVRWLREQALRQEWAEQGALASWRGLGERSTRETVRKALEARAKDEAGELDAEDAAALDRWLAERPSLPVARREALATQRLEQAEAVLREAHGIEASRITRRPASADPVNGAPIVHIEIGPVTR